MRRSISVLAKKDGDFRTESLHGSEHLIIPVVALVEGVLQGMNAAEPELALAEEFGKTPAGWNGRPLVMNHPVVDGSPVSANSPEVLESYAFGQIFNTSCADGKLKCEAWVNKTRVSELGGEVEDTIDRILAGEVVEISTGLFTDLEEKKGRFNGEDYAGIWRNIVPDHLAFLSEGVKGACSVEDGCGTPRTNSAWRALAAKPKTSASAPGSDCGCGCGGKCKDVPHNHEHSESGVTKPVILANSVPADMTYADVSSLLNTALQMVMGNDYYYLMTFSQDKVVYYSYLYEDGRSKSGYYQRSYSIDAGGQVTLGSDAERVNLLTEIVPAVDPKVNQESVMPDDKTKQTTPATPSADDQKNNTKADDKTTAKADGQDGAEGNAGDPGVETPPEPKTQAAAPAPTPSTPAQPIKFNSVKEYLDAAPPEMKDMIQSGLRLHNEKKGSLIKALKETGRCKFSDEALKAMSMDELQNLADLAAVPSYEGQGSTRIVDNSEDNTIPAAPKLDFSANTAALPGVSKH